jgi:transposase
MTTPSRKSSSAQKKSGRQMFCQRYAKIEDMPVINEHAAGIDLSGDISHFVAIEIGDEVEVREFGGMTPNLHELVDYLITNKITTVAMEATGVYWMPVYDLLEEGGLQVYLVNPRHVKNVPGRKKNDKLDSRWLRKLHKYGLLSASFRPAEEIRPLRSLRRQRKTIVELAADEIRRMHKALDVMNVRVHKAITDLCGLTGLRIVRAIIAGERDPAVLAGMRDPHCKCTTQELIDALTGHYMPHEIVALKQALERYDCYVAQMASLDKEIKAYLTSLIPLSDDDIAAKVSESTIHLPKGKHMPEYNVAAYVELFTGQDPTVLPGIGAQSALELLAELGKDMTKWSSAGHFGSFLSLAPMQRISGGKVLSSRTRPGSHPAAVIFRQAAVSQARADTALGAFYRRLASRIGKAKAVTATAYKIARMYYHLMKDGRAYIEIGEEAYEEKYREHQIASLVKKAERLGYTVTPVAA